MKFYIASRFGLKDKVKEMCDILQEKGHETTTDFWLSHKSIKPYTDNLEFAKQYSVEDINGVLESDVFVIIGDEAGTGMYIELGAAIAQQIKTGKPKIYAIGEHTTRALFYFHPSVIRKNNFEEVLEDLGI